MNIYIGQLLDEGVIRYVTASLFHNKRITHILRNFYPKEARVTELIALGNLVMVRPTPFGKSTYYDDEIHCRAEIRDEKEKKGKHLPKYADSQADYQKTEGHLFLFKNGCWHYKNGDVFTTEMPDELPASDNKPFAGLELYKINKDGKMTRSYDDEKTTWSVLQETAKEKQIPYFVFRKNKLITTVNHPITQQ